MNSTMNSTSTMSTAAVASEAQDTLSATNTPEDWKARVTLIRAIESGKPADLAKAALDVIDALLRRLTVEELGSVRDNLDDLQTCTNDYATMQLPAEAVEDHKAAKAVEDCKAVDIVKAAVDTIDSQWSRMSIKEIESVLESLEVLQINGNDCAMSRIPADRLAKVEGEYHLLLSFDVVEPDEKTYQAKAINVLSAAPLTALFDYAQGLLEEVQKIETGLSEYAEYYVAQLPPVVERRKALFNATEEIGKAVAAHGVDVSAKEAGLDPAVLETLALPPVTYDCE